MLNADGKVGTTFCGRLTGLFSRRGRVLVFLCHESSKGQPLTHAEILSQIINRLNPDDPGHARGHVRRVRLHLDPAQYALDAAARQQRQHAQEGSAGGGDSVYSTFNVIM